jgi:hypothetical protein
MTSPDATGTECWSSDEENFLYDSLGELLDAEEIEVGQTVYVGEQSDASAYCLVDADDIVEMFNERAYDNFGECAEDWPDVTKEAKAELSTFLAAWIERHSPQKFYRVVNVKKYTVTAEDLKS